LLCKKLSESNKLPHTLGVLEERIKHVRLHSRVWCQANLSQQQPFDPLQFGYCKDTDRQILPVSTKVLPAPQAIIEMCTPGHH